MSVRPNLYPTHDKRYYPFTESGLLIHRIEQNLDLFFLRIFAKISF